MGIRDKRLAEAINRILREELQKGNLPSSKEFMWRLQSYLDQHDLSRPEYNFRPVRRGTKAVSSDYNNTIDTVYRDMLALYTSSIDLNNSITKNLSKFDVDKAKVEYEIDTLENQLEQMILMYGNSGFLSSVYDVFTDLKKIDTANSTVNVDIKKHEVAISDNKNTSTRIAPNATTYFRILDDIANMVNVVTISGKTDNVLNDNTNEFWQQYITSDSAQTVGGYFYIKFDKDQIMNRISISLLGIKETNMRVEFTPDNINWFVLPYYEDGVIATDGYTFDFPSISMKQVRILLSKSESDNQSMGNGNTSQYSFTLGIKNIKLFMLDFAEDAVLTSVPLKVEYPSNQNFSIDKVSLQADEFLPNGTDIKYYISLPPEDGEEPEWKPICPINRANPTHDQIIDFKNITNAPPVHMSMDKAISTAEYEIESLYSNGIKFYKIGSVPLSKQIIAGTERLFVGTNTWGVKYFNGQYADHNTHIPTLDDWSNPLDTIQYDYIKMDDVKSGLILDGKKHTQPISYMFTIGAYSENKETVVTSVPASTEPIAIYMNGVKLFEGIPNANTKINYLFINGWNEIVVLSYIRNYTATAGATIDLSFDPKSYAANIYSQAKPMTKVALSDLQLNVKANDRDKYAISVINEEQYIILNYAVPGLQYDFYCNQVEGDAKDTILFKAEFVRDRTVTSISPKLSKYYLRFA